MIDDTATERGEEYDPGIAPESMNPERESVEPTEPLESLESLETAGTAEPEEDVVETEMYRVEAFGWSDPIHQIPGRGGLDYTPMTTFCRETEEGELYSMFLSTAAAGPSMYDVDWFLDRDRYNETRAEDLYWWGEGVSDVLKAAIESSEVEVGDATVVWTGEGQPGNPLSQGTTTHLTIDGETLPVEFHAGVLAALFSGNDVYVQDDLWTDAAQMSRFSDGYDVSLDVFHPAEDAAAYRPRQAPSVEDHSPATYESYELTADNDHLLLFREEDQGYAGIAPDIQHLSDRASDQLRTQITGVPRRTREEYTCEWFDLVKLLATNTEEGEKVEEQTAAPRQMDYIATFERTGTTPLRQTPGDETPDRVVQVEVDSLYVELDGDAYEVPARDFPSIVLGGEESFKIPRKAENLFDRTFY